MRTIAIIQARMTSTRLPGKVLADLNGRPMLEYMLARVQRARRLDGLVLATTVNGNDDEVADLGFALGVPVFRGDEADVLGRFVGASGQAEAEAIVRLTADCPLIDPAVVDEGIALFASGCFDYVSNAIVRTYPDGLDIEIFTRAALEQAHREAALPFHREHVTPYLRTGVYDDVPTGDFRVGHLRAPADFSHLRWTVDTPRDLERVRAIVREVPDDHGWMDVLALLTRKPSLLGSSAPAAERIVLRPAVTEDADLLFEWVNRPDSLANKLQTEGPIDRETHVAWLNEKLTSAETGIWIAEADGEPAGQVRLERRGGALEVDIYVAPEQRGRGTGAAMLDAARHEAARRWPGVPLLARVKTDNWPSRQLFAKAGFGRMTVARDHLILHREPAKPTGAAA